MSIESEHGGGGKEDARLLGGLRTLVRCVCGEENVPMVQVQKAGSLFYLRIQRLKPRGSCNRSRVVERGGGVVSGLLAVNAKK